MQRRTRRDLVIKPVAAVPLADQLGLILHEIRQPLAAVFALAEMARSRPGVPPEACHDLDEIIEQVQELAEAARSALLAADGAVPDDDGPADLDEVLDSVLHAFRLTWGGTIRRAGWHSSLLVPVARGALRRCLVNLLDNAVRAAGPAGTVGVTVRRAEMVRVIIGDAGPGFGNVPRGSGLGLAAARACVSPAGGEVAVGPPSKRRGARVCLTLPTLTDQHPDVAGAAGAG